MFAILLLLLGVAAQPPHWLESDDAGVRFACSHSRWDTVVDALRWLDRNGDSCVDVGEMTEAFERCLTWYERIGMQVGRLLGRVQTPETTMDQCDRNDDRRMCIDDVLASNVECAALHTQADVDAAEHTCLCTCQSIDALYSFVLDREPCD